MIDDLLNSIVESMWLGIALIHKPLIFNTLSRKESAYVKTDYSLFKIYCFFLIPELVKFMWHENDSNIILLVLHFVFLFLAIICGLESDSSLTHFIFLYFVLHKYMVGVLWSSTSKTWCRRLEPVCVSSFIHTSRSHELYRNR